jgi:hypothetical protein
LPHFGPPTSRHIGQKGDKTTDLKDFKPDTTLQF